MKNIFRKGLTLLMVLCLLVPLFGVSVLAKNTGELPIDYQFKAVDAPDPDRAQVLAADMTNDPYSSRQWGMKMIGMEAAWQSGLTGEGVRVAIIDTGVSTQTRDIDPDRLLTGKSFVDGVDSTEDTMGHGTFVAGIIGATKDNGIGIAGIAPGVTIIPLRTSTDGKSKDKLGTAAVYAAVDDFDCDIINISYGSKYPQTGMREALQHAISKGVIVICAGGNSGDESLFYPAAFPEAIGVGGVNKYLEKSSFSHTNNSIFVTAPGNDIVSLNLTNGAVREANGSSYSTPVVTGIAALLREAHPEMTNDQFKEILKASCWDLGDEGYDTTFGWGLVQAPKAILKAAEYFGTAAPDMPEIPDPAPEPPPEPTPDPGSSWGIWDLFNFDWLRELFQNIIRSLFKGWNLSF